MKKILILSIFLTFFGYSIYGKCQDNSLIDAEKQKQLECCKCCCCERN